MFCPYCQKPVAEEASGCAECGLDLGKLDQVLGIPPVIQAGLKDQGGRLTRSGVRQIQRVMRQFSDRFPQIRLALVLEEAPGVVPLRTWVWWLFNRGSFSVALDKGFANRDILLALDPARRQAALTIGYGLEPFVGQRDLGNALEAALPALAAGDWAGSFIQILKTLDHVLETIVDRMPQTYGVPLPLLVDETNEPAEIEERTAVW